jgi:hypothetical protein
MNTTHDTSVCQATGAACHNADAVHPRTRHDALEELIAARMRTPFQWGEHDCCLWAADAVQAQTGVDHAAEFRGGYETAAGALRALDAAGGLASLAARAGEPVPPLLAGLGDVGVVMVDGTDVLGVCAGPVWLVAATNGLAAVAFDACSTAWKVGNA